MKKAIVGIVFILAILVAFSSGAFFSDKFKPSISSAKNIVKSESNIKGRIGIMLGDGSLRSGTRLKIEIVTKSFPISYNPMWEATGYFDRQEAILKSLTNFARQSAKEKDTNPDYVIAETISNLDGQFEFKNVKIGDYFILVDFPATIGMNKVLWQVPISVKKGETVEVELSNDNLAMPAYYEGRL